MDANLFELATRQKLRFETPKGLLSVEDIWDLPLTSSANKANLDDIAKGLYHSLKQSGEGVSFVSPVDSTATRVQELQFDVVKHVIAVRIAERDKAADAAQRAAKKQRLLEIIATKQDESLRGKSLDELLKEVEAL